ncbi:MAG: hypothetical protein ABI638_11830 [Ignavibacteriota bacterium]
MKTITSLSILLILLSLIGCEKKYSLEESKLMNETKELIEEYKFSVAKQEHSLKKMDALPEFKDMIYEEHQHEWNKSLVLKSAINKNINTLKMTGIEYDFGIIPDDLSIERWEYLKEHKTK